MNVQENMTQSDINEIFEALSNVIASLSNTIDKLFPALSSITTESCNEELYIESVPAPVRCSCKMSSELLDIKSSVRTANDKMDNILERLNYKKGGEMK